MRRTLLIIEDDQVMRQTLAEVFEKRGHRLLQAASGDEGLTLYQVKKVDLLLLDLRLPDCNGLEVLKEIRDRDDFTPIIVLTALPDVKTAVTAIKLGATDYLTKPFELEELKILVDRSLETASMRDDVTRLRRLKEPPVTLARVVGVSPKAKELETAICDIAKAPKTTVLIIGETGTGKEMIADAIHSESERRDAPLVKVNCSAVPSHLMESEFFGFEKGAFTDAKATKKGLLELADGGSLVLDEVSEMPLTLQTKLLRVLEYQTFKRVGGVKNIDVDVRLIALTNIDLAKAVTEKRFREDLFYRLKVFQITVPPLRERREDIPWLVEKFLRDFDLLFRRSFRISDQAEDLLKSYHWPGNIRELKNVIERACILASLGEIQPVHLPQELMTASKDDLPPEDILTRIGNLSLKEVEKNQILAALKRTGGNKSEAARILGIARITLREKLKMYGINSGLNEG